MAEAGGKREDVAASRRKTGDKLNLSPERLKLLQQELDEHGVAVLPGIFTEEECDNHITQLHQWLTKFGHQGFPDNIGSIIHSYNIAHHPVAWETRLKAAPVFEALWGTDKLVSSIDGMAIGHPPELGFESFDTYNNSLNLHLDQGQKKVGLHGYQGAVYLEEALEDDWCFAVMDKSHLFHDKYWKTRSRQPRSEFCRLTEKEIEWYKSLGCPIRRIAVPKGGMVLWDSRTVHTGARPKQHRENPGRWRYVVFACMAPAIWASTQEMATKREGFQKLMCSRHWPGHGFGLFPNRSKPSAHNAVNELPPIALTDKARLLAGDLEYDFSSGPKGPPKPICLP